MTINSLNTSLDSYLQPNYFEYNSRLVDAVQKNDLTRVKRLLKKGASPNACNQKQIPAIFYALENQSLDCIKLLHQYGADLQVQRKGDWNLTTGAYALKFFDIFQYLLESKSSTLFSMDGQSYATAFVIKLNQDQDYKKYNAEIKRKNPQEHAIAKEMIDQKIIAHAWKIKGTGSIWSRNYREFQFELCGISELYCWHKMAKYTKLFFEHCPQQLSVSVQKALTNAITKASYEAISTSEKALNYFRLTDLLFLNGGFKEHYIGLAFCHNHFIISNRGSGREVLNQNSSSQQTIRIFRFNRDKLTAQIIQDIQDLKFKPKAEYSKYLTKLSEHLEFSQDEIESVLESCLNMPPQKVGNCAWENAEGLVWAVSSLQNLDAFYFDKGLQLTERDALNIQSTIEHNRGFFDQWLSFQQTTLLQKYHLKHRKIQQEQKLDIAPNEDLLTKVYKVQAKQLPAK